MPRLANQPETVKATAKTAIAARSKDQQSQIAQSMGEALTETQQQALANLDEFEAAELRAAEQLAQRKAVAIASFQALVDQKTLAYLNQIRAMETRAQQQFSTIEAFETFVVDMTDLTIGGFAPEPKQLSEAQP
jgi:hypothetical protein